MLDALGDDVGVGDSSWVCCGMCIGAICDDGVGIAEADEKHDEEYYDAVSMFGFMHDGVPYVYIRPISI